MSLAIKLLQGGNTPTLYSFYGKQYDYNDLALAADQGLNEYLSTLKRGEKDSIDFRSAYTNIMSGIKDGTITFDNGQFHDSKGRYTNSDKKHKDYYGLIANYIYGKMGKSDEYKKPDDPSKIKWDNGSVKTALMRLLFNSDTGNLLDFLDLDLEKNGVRSIANRSTYLANALQSIADNWDTTFQGYLDTDKSRYIPILQNAAQSLRDGTIDPGDYLALSNAVGGVNFREMLDTGTPINPPVNNTTGSTPPSNTLGKLKHASLSDTSYDASTLNSLTSAMSQVPTKGLINILRLSFYNRHYKFNADPRIGAMFGDTSSISSKAGVTATLNALYAQNMLRPADSNNPNLYYIPGLRTRKGTGWVWDKSNNTVTEMPLLNIPFAKAKLEAMVAAHKNGGIIKAELGTSLLWYNGLVDFDSTKYLTSHGSILRGIDNKGVYGNPYGNNGIGANNSRYKSDKNFSDYTLNGKSYASEVENQQYYKDFTNDLLSAALEYTNAKDKSSFNDDNNIFLRWAHLVDKGLPSNSTSTFFDENGNLRTSWGVTNKDSYNRGPRQPITNLSEYITSVRNDLLLANRHNDLMKEGTRYFYNDLNGNKHWVDPEIAKSGKYLVSTNGIKSVDGNVNWTDYELTGLSSNGQPTDLNGTNIDRTEQGKNKPNWFLQNGEKLALDVAPLTVGAGRLFDSISTNNRVANEMRSATKPVLKDTYELYSPVTGAFSEMQFRNRQAADVRRQAALPYTSDASLNSARSLEANKLANDLQYQGFLADDKEIQRTKAEALKRLEDNILRRTETANFNRASINLNTRELAQLEASRLKSNWQSRDNFLSGIEAELRGKLAQRDADRRNEIALNRQRSLDLDISDLNRPFAIEERNLKSKYNFDKNELARLFNSKLANWLATNGEDADYTSLEFYTDYIQKQRDLLDKYNTDSDDIANRQSKSTRLYIDGIRTKMNLSSLFRRGGKFSPATIKLLHKVMN